MSRIGPALQVPEIQCSQLFTDRSGGALAQLGEHLLCKQRVIGSIPIGSTKLWLRQDLVEPIGVLVCHIVKSIWRGLHHLAPSSILHPPPSCTRLSRVLGATAWGV